MMSSTVHVAVAVIRHPDRPGAILVAKRPQHLHQGGKWEFPGGKVEPGESIESALDRELSEELGIDAREAPKAPLIHVLHDYPDKSVWLDVWTVFGFHGTPHGAEGQTVRWVSVDAMSDLEFPEANQRIISALQLPEIYAFYPSDGQDWELSGWVKGHSCRPPLLRIRTRDASCVPDRAVFHRLASDARLVLPHPLPDWAHERINHDSRIMGVHLSSDQLPRMTHLEMNWYRARNWRVFGSCHNAQEVALANQLSLDGITISPVLPTSSHPGHPGIGWQQFRELAELAIMPVYALGGQSSRTLDMARRQGAIGVAGISDFFE